MNNPTIDTTGFPSQADAVASTGTASADAFSVGHVANPQAAQARTAATQGNFITGLGDSARAARPSAGSGDEDSEYESHLAVVRLGIASSLFYALRSKHAPTAAHGLRVALSCSAWCERQCIDEENRDRLEVAALLHDVGKIGIPDRILRKPGRLSVEEQLTMDLTPELGCEILRGCTSDQTLLDTVLHSRLWYQSRRHQDAPSGNAIPFGSRMLAIADAFDSMTTDTVYRRALSREHALNELMTRSGTQFDPDLVVEFMRMLEERPEILQGSVVQRWLTGLEADSCSQLWTGADPTARNGRVGSSESVFFQSLLSNLHDGIAFTDAEGTITHWNDAIQAMTGISGEAMLGNRWTDEGIRIRASAIEKNKNVAVVDQCLGSNATVRRSMLIEQPGDDSIPVQVTASPVSGPEPGIKGAVIIIQDISQEKTLMQQVETLHEKSTLDPLTQVANRAHFDDELKDAIRQATNTDHSFSLIICDIDHFKAVNDTHGHPAGDEALINFAEILKSKSRPNDLVARYGGEEFLVLSPDCDNSTAAKRAEGIRQSLENTPLPSIGNKPVTASFGVTEFQVGDTAESVVKRADRALLKAKDNGRNRVVQLGLGNRMLTIEKESSRSSWLPWRRSSGPKAKPGEYDIVTPVPVDLVIEKLRGFIADHGAEIVTVSESQLVLNVRASCASGGRRRVDQRIMMKTELTLSRAENGDDDANRSLMTNVHVNMEPVRVRDRRNPGVEGGYKQLLYSLKAYLIGEVRKN